MGNSRLFEAKILMSIKKAIIILDKSEDRILSIGRVVPAEFWLLGGQPLIEYLVDEAIKAGAEQIIFVGPADKKNIADYFQPTALMEKSDDDEGGFASQYGSIDFSFMAENGTIGAALLKMKNRIIDEPVAIIQNKALLFGSEGSLMQLSRVMNTTDRPVLGLITSESEGPSFKTEKIAERIYKLKEVEMGGADQSKLCFAGRSILTPAVIDVISEIKKSRGPEELNMLSVIAMMVNEGKTVYGYHLKGDWFALDNKQNWLAANRALISDKNEKNTD